MSFGVPGGELEGTLHLPETRALGGVAVLHGFGGHPEQPHVVATCDALANAGVAALRFAYRDHQPPRMTLASGLADASGAIRLLKAHPEIPEALGVVGFSFGGAVAALVAGRDSRIRVAVLAAAPARFGDDDKLKPLAEATRTRARVLLIWGSRDTQVPVANAERYASVLSQARVTNRTVIIEGGDHDFSPATPRDMMAQRVAEFCREALAS
ncbi:MAG: alpha/beta family hydrolase [Chloroflexota bacterium]